MISPNISYYLCTNSLTLDRQVLFPNSYLPPLKQFGENFENLNFKTPAPLQTRKESSSNPKMIFSIQTQS